MNRSIEKWYDKYSDDVIGLAKEIWSNPEPLMEEYNSCAKTVEFLEKQGFDVMAYHCQDKNREPNTIVATWGSGKPVIGIMGEYDALKGMGQEDVPYHKSKPGFGHGCGHNLIAPAAASAAAAAKAAIEAEGLTGTIKFLGCPAEEGGSGKLYMVRDGLFDDIDCCMFWHPKGCDIIPYESILQAISNMTFEFYGVPAHAAASPELGRSALDAAELMNVGIQYLREHIPEDSRIHYSYLAAGDRPNIVPEYASLYYYVRSKDIEANKELIERVKKVARGAAMMTETEVKITLNSMCPDTFIVTSFNDFLYNSAAKVPKFEYTEKEEEYAKTLYKNALGEEPAGSVLFTGLDKPTGITNRIPGSTDAGFVTYKIPTSRLFGLGIIKDVPMHHWAVTSTVGMSIGFKAALFAGKAIAQCAYDICKSPEVVETWWEELRSKQGESNFEPVWPE